MPPSIRLAGIVSVVSLAIGLPTSSATAAEPSQVLTWNQIALAAVERAKPTQHQAIRLLAHLSLAQHAALTETAATDGNGDAVATASMRVIAELLPSQAVFVADRHLQSQSSLSDAGSRAAERVLAQARSDGFAAPWNGAVPQGDQVWRSLANPAAKPAYPAIGAMRMFFLPSGAAVRPASPPGPESQQFITDLAEVRQYVTQPTEATTRIAKFYDMTTGTLAGGFWNEQAAALLARSTVDDRQAATVLATVNAAMMDALAACHEAKYTYWVPRPSQVDPSLKTIIGVPNHPSYPSNHSGLSAAAAQVLAHFFPSERPRLEATATEAGLSRIYAGIHYRFDVDAGEQIGRKVAAAAVSGYAEMLARSTRTTVSGL